MELLSTEKEIESPKTEVNFEELTSEIKLGFLKERRVVYSLIDLVGRLKEKIPNYNTILSDDASGRLVSRFLRHIVNKKRAELGEELVPIFFLAGGRHSNTGSMKEQLRKAMKKRGGDFKKTLLVTEYIETGRNISSLVQVLEEAGIDFDVAAVSVAINPEAYKNNLSKRLYYGSIGDAGLSFWRKGTGVHVVSGSEVESAIVRNKEEPEKQAYVNQARIDIKVLAEKIYNLTQ